MLVAINVIAIFNLLILTAFLTIKKPRGKTNYFLAFTIITPAFALFFNTLVYLGKAHLYPISMHLSMGLNLLWAPAFYYYVLLMVGKPLKIKWKDFYHFLPFIISVVFSIWFTGLSYKEKYLFFKNLKHTSPLPLLLLNSLMMYQVFIYLIVSVYIIYRYNQRLKNSFSYIQKLSMKWLIEYIFACVALSLVAFLPILINPELKVFMTFLPLATSLLYIFIVYKTLTRPVIFMQNDDLGNFRKKLLLEENKFSNQIIPLEVLRQKAQLLEVFLEENKIYKDPELTLKTLAEKVEIPAYVLSQTINRVHNRNFFEFINTYRVEEAKKMLNDPGFSNITIEAIAYECGFGSRASFYNTFKKIARQNPSSFKKNS